jgi:hypothetical protein
MSILVETMFSKWCARGIVVLIDCCLLYWCLELILMGLVEFLIYLGCSSTRVHKCLKLSMYHSWKIVADRHIEVGPRPIIHTNAKASRAFGIICSQSGCIRPRWSPTHQRTCCNVSFLSFIEWISPFTPWVCILWHTFSHLVKILL